MTEFIYYNVNVQFRVPVNEDGTLGNPEIVKKFTNQMKGKTTAYVVTPGEANKAKKKSKDAKNLDRFKMKVGA